MFRPVDDVNKYFNPRPPRGGRRLDFPGNIRLSLLFQSTPPARGATWAMQIGGACSMHFNPRPPRGGRRERKRAGAGACGISIHAPREGGDSALVDVSFVLRNFNPRPPRGGRRMSSGRIPHCTRYFNPRPPRGGRRFLCVVGCESFIISIHAPREGGDFGRWSSLRKWRNFNPRPPRGGRLYRLQHGL